MEKSCQISVKENVLEQRTSSGEPRIELLYKNLNHLKALERHDEDCDYVEGNIFPYDNVSDCRQAIREENKRKYTYKQGSNVNHDNARALAAGYERSSFGVNLWFDSRIWKHYKDFCSLMRTSSVFFPFMNDNIEGMEAMILPIMKVDGGNVLSSQKLCISAPHAGILPINYSLALVLQSASWNEMESYGQTTFWNVHSERFTSLDMDLFLIRWIKSFFGKSSHADDDTGPSR